MKNMFDKPPLNKLKNLALAATLALTPMVSNAEKAPETTKDKAPSANEISAAQKENKNEDHTMNFQDIEKTSPQKLFQFHAEEVANYFDNLGDKKKADEMRQLKNLPQVIADYVRELLDDPHNAHLNLNNPHTLETLVTIVLSSKAVAPYQTILSIVLSGQMGSSANGSVATGEIDVTTGKEIRVPASNGGLNENHSVDFQVHHYFGSALSDLVSIELANQANHAGGGSVANK